MNVFRPLAAPKAPQVRVLMHIRLSQIIDEAGLTGDKFDEEQSRFVLTRLTQVATGLSM
jgi:hypothetical protein